MIGTLELTGLPFDFAQDGFPNLSKVFEGFSSCLNKLFDHIRAFYTIAKRSIIFPGANATKH